MKQNITIDQLNELSEEGKERLREWWKPKDGDLYVKRLTPELLKEYFYSPEWDDEPEVLYSDDEYSIPDYSKKEMYRHDGFMGLMYPLLSIGQMIELLGDEWNEKAQCFMVTNDGVVFPNIYCGNDCLCDYLWSAVKQVLEDKKL